MSCAPNSSVWWAGTWKGTVGEKLINLIGNSESQAWISKFLSMSPFDCLSLHAPTAFLAGADMQMAAVHTGEDTRILVLWV